MCATGDGGRSEGHGQLPGKLVTAPLDRFDDLTGKDGDRYELTNYHQRSVLRLEDFKKVVKEQEQLDTESCLDTAYKEEIRKNREMMVPIVDTLLTGARQNIALRGHRGEAGVVSATGVDRTESDGNLRALLRYRIRNGDKILQRVRWKLLYEFCCKFHSLSRCKNTISVSI